MTTVIALLRRVNVGRRRVPMPDLRAAVEALGYQHVRTLLNTGNVVFDTALPAPRVPNVLQPALERRFGFEIAMSVISVDDLRGLLKEHPWTGHDGHYASRQLVAFPSRPGQMSRARPLLAHDWGDEAIVIGRHGAYLWCPEGIAHSPLALAFARATGDVFTTRNWSTMLKLQAFTERPPRPEPAVRAPACPTSPSGSPAVPCS